MEPLGGVAYNVPEDEEFLPLSGKPYFNVFLEESHLHPAYELKVPSKMYSHLPDSDVPAVLTYRGNKWEIPFNGASKVKMFGDGWKDFVVDNNLKEWDACLFEIMEFNGGILKIRVQILRGDFPDELLEPGDACSKPIVIEDD